MRYAFPDPFIIAEIGHNHMGNLAVCKRMFAEAKRCGANAVKLQKRDNKSLFTKAAFDKPYENRNSYGPTYGLHREALEFGFSEYQELKDYANELDILFFSTPFDFPSVDFLEQLDMPMYKIASADCTNTPLIDYVTMTGKPVIVSTGGASWTDIDRAYEYVDPERTAFLHCVATYPNEASQMNLKVVAEMKKRYPLLSAVGLSDHYNGICMAEAAYILGAMVIEKHFTLNHSWKGTDHALSLEPQGLESLVHNINRIRLAMGDGEKKVLEPERLAIEKMGKSLYPLRPIMAGEVLTEEKVCIKSPGGGLPPWRANDDFFGRVVISDLSTGVPISEDDLS